MKNCVEGHILIAADSSFAGGLVESPGSSCNPFQNRVILQKKSGRDLGKKTSAKECGS